MQSRSPKITIKMGGKRPEITPPTVTTTEEILEKNGNPLEGPSVPSNNDGKEPDQNGLDISSSEYSSDDDDNDKDNDDNNKQMVVYDYSMNGSEVVKTVKNPSPDKPRAVPRKPPEVGAFTVQCANCLKWRLIPDQEKYEVIREHITDQPFLCETTRQWNRVVSCDDPTDIEQDGTRIWAIDKPDIARAPPGWKRLLRLRNEGSSKFADVYYVTPTGAKVRSLPDVIRFFETHPEHAQVGLGRFSFQIPRPLRDDYVKKRPTQMAAPKTPETLEPSPVEPIAWAGPAKTMELQIVEPISWAGPEDDKVGMAAYLKTPEPDLANRAAKKAKSFDVNYL